MPTIQYWGSEDDTNYHVICSCSNATGSLNVIKTRVIGENNLSQCPVCNKVPVKLCNGCHKLHPITEYSSSSGYSDGLNDRCYYCCHEETARNNKKRKWEPGYQHRKIKESLDRQAKENPDYYLKKEVCRATTNYYIRAGILVRSSKCDVCGKECVPHAHHRNYDDPMDIAWLCTSCHGIEHGKSRRVRGVPNTSVSISKAAHHGNKRRSKSGDSNGVEHVSYASEVIRTAVDDLGIVMYTVSKRYGVWSSLLSRLYYRMNAYTWGGTDEFIQAFVEGTPELKKRLEELGIIPDNFLVAGSVAPLNPEERKTVSKDRPRAVTKKKCSNSPKPVAVFKNYEFAGVYKSVHSCACELGLNPKKVSFCCTHCGRSHHGYTFVILEELVKDSINKRTLSAGF